MVRHLKLKGYWVRGVDLKRPQFSESASDEFALGDLRDPSFALKVSIGPFDEVYQLAADMGGAGYIFTGEHDGQVMHNSAMINLNIVESLRIVGVGKVFYSSSACIYPEPNQMDPEAPVTAESTAYPAAPDSEYGWEKLFSERMYFAYARNYGMSVRVARFHNIFGEEGTWAGGREKAPAAVCRKVATARDGEQIEIWGDGRQTRSFLYISECLEGVERLMASDFPGPVNIGSEEMISINNFAQMVIRVSGKQLRIKNTPGPLGVRGRFSDNRLIREKLGWAPSQALETGIRRTYAWIHQQVASEAPSA